VKAWSLQLLISEPQDQKKMNMRFEEFRAGRVQIVIFWVVKLGCLYVVTDILEEHMPPFSA
jgi:hypothetical protein